MIYRFNQRRCPRRQNRYVEHISDPNDHVRATCLMFHFTPCSINE